MLASADVPIGETLVVLNGEPARTRAELGDGVTYIDPAHNLGVAASWNFIIRARPAARWWLICNHDIEFRPGELQQIADAMDTPAARIVEGYSYGAFALNQACVDRVGWFDENLHPIYFEDNDYRRRCQLAHVSIVDLGFVNRHPDSATINSGYRRQNDRTFPDNAAYYVAKWGGPPGRETATNATQLRLDRRRLVNNAWT